ncbi:MAG: polysaccharide deacetylase family protein [Oscillospiraceae bacterium]
MVYKLNLKIISIILIAIIALLVVVKTVPANANVQQTKLPVIMYHHILENSNKLGDYVISPKQFEQDIKYITDKGYTAITSKELLNFLKYGDTLPEKPIMITFDDGYESVYKYAYPILKKYNQKAITLIIGKYTDLFSDENEPRHINYSHLSYKQLLEISDMFEIGNHTYNMHQNAQGKRYGCKKISGETYEDYKLALTNDVGYLSQKIIDNIGYKPKCFAYPFGAISKESKVVLEDFGFEVFFTCLEKVNIIEPFTKTPVYINRFNRPTKYSTKEFFNKMDIN